MCDITCLYSPCHCVDVLLVTMVTHHWWAECVLSVTAACGVPSTHSVIPWPDSVTVRPGSKVGHVTSVKSDTCCRELSVGVSNYTQTHTCYQCSIMSSVLYHMCFYVQHVMTSAPASCSMTWTCCTTTSCLSTWLLLLWHRTASLWPWRTGPETCRYKPRPHWHQRLLILKASHCICWRF